MQIKCVVKWYMGKFKVENELPHNPNLKIATIKFFYFEMCFFKVCKHVHMKVILYKCNCIKSAVL